MQLPPPWEGILRAERKISLDQSQEICRMTHASIFNIGEGKNYREAVANSMVGALEQAPVML